MRIIDNADAKALYTDINRKGKLPSWRVIANDLRTHDAIKSLVEIPATVIDVGDFKNVPYKSFRVNNEVELNIYGDPENPAGVELGIYGPRSDKQSCGRLFCAATWRDFLPRGRKLAPSIRSVSTKASLKRETSPSRSRQKMRRMPTAHGGFHFIIARICKSPAERRRIRQTRETGERGHRQAGARHLWRVEQGRCA